MYQSRVRVIKRDQRGAAEQTRPAGESDGQCAERVMQVFVSEWVREHARRAEEYRQEYAALLRKVGFRYPSSVAP